MAIIRTSVTKHLGDQPIQFKFSHQSRRKNFEQWQRVRNALRESRAVIPYTDCLIVQRVLDREFPTEATWNSRGWQGVVVYESEWPAVSKALRSSAPDSPCVAYSTMTRAADRAKWSRGDEPRGAGRSRQ